MSAKTCDLCDSDNKQSTEGGQKDEVLQNR